MKGDADMRFLLKVRDFCPRLVLLFGIVGMASLAGFSQRLVATRPVLEAGRFYRIGVPAEVPWTDTRYDVSAGQRIRFKARGGISLQQGNPSGFCGPDGLTFSTAQQPLPETNYGSLIGKVVRLISVEIDEETGEETRNEIVEYFYIGSEQTVVMPIDGSLYLGINELVVQDNSGALSVEFERVVERF
jgi:hypothetical protein